MRLRIFFLLLIILPFVLFTKLIFAQTPENFYGVSVDPTNPGVKADPQDLKEMGIGLVRVVYKDDPVAKQYIGELINNGITPVLVLNWEANDQAWYSGDIENYPQTFQNVVVKPAVSEYGGKVIYQIWNEPDGTVGTVPLSAYEYSRILSTAYETIKNSVSSAKVITAGLVSGNPDYASQLVGYSGGQLPADGVGYHPYIYSLEAVRQGILELAGRTGIPVWITEFGLGTSDQQKQAEWIRAVFGLSEDAKLKQVLQSVMWYAWSDAMKAGYGLVDQSGNPKEELRAFLESVFGGELPADFLDKFDFSPFLVVSPPPPALEEGIDWGVTLGEPFIITGKENEAGGLGEEVERVRELVLRYFETAKINSIALTMASAFEKINLPQNLNLTRRDPSKGYVDFYYCRKGSAEWPRFAGAIEFDTPAYYKQAATATYQYADMLTMPNSRVARSPIASNFSPSSRMMAAENFDTNPEETMEEGKVLAEQDSGFHFIIEPSSCIVSAGVANCEINIKGSERRGHMWVFVNDNFVGINAVPGPDQAPNTYRASIPCPAGGCAIRVTAINLDIQEHPTVNSSCDISGGASCSFSGVVEVEPPPPPVCEVSSYDIGNSGITKEPVSVRGTVGIKGFFAKLVESTRREFKNALGEIIDRWEEKIFDLRKYVVFPYIAHPYTNASEAKFRQEASVPFTLPGKTHNFEHTQTKTEYEFGNKELEGEKEGTVYGSYGWNEAYEYDVQMVSPP